MTTPQPVNKLSADITAERLDALKNLIPEAFTEGRIDFTKLREALGDIIDDGPERYNFTWVGKRDAIRALQAPTSAALVPCKQESINWDTTQHIFIEGENMEVLKLLYKAYFGKVKLIYIDPPYNTGNDFIYSDNYSDPLGHYLRLTHQVDAGGNQISSSREANGRYHSRWLNMMYPRLFLARQLLRDDGAIMVSIADHEVHNLRLLLNEIFGEENFIATVIWQKIYSPKNTADYFSEDHDYVVIFARNKPVWSPTLFPRTEAMDARYKNPDKDPRGRWKPGGLDARNYYGKGTYSITCPGGRMISGPPPGSYWRVSEEKFWKLDKDNRIWWGEDSNSVPSIKRFLSEVKAGKVPQTLWKHTEVGHTQDAKKELLEYVDFESTDNVLDTVKPIRLIQQILQVSTSSDEEDIVLDFFAGGASTAHGTLMQNLADGGNRRFILVQWPEPLDAVESTIRTIADIAKTRLRSAIKRLSDNTPDVNDDEVPIDLGFRAFKLAISHFLGWTGLTSPTPDQYLNEMRGFGDPLFDGFDPQEVIWEVAIKEGYPLTSRVETVPVQGHAIFRITDRDTARFFHICLDGEVSSGVVNALKLEQDDLFVCRDLAIDDSVAANLALNCRLKTI